MTDRPILSIPIDSSEFDAFLEKYKDYRASLEQQPDKWAGINAEIEEMTSSFEEAAVAFGKIGGAAGDHRVQNFFLFASKQTSQIEKSTKNVSNFWTHIGKDIEKSSRLINDLARGSFAGALGGVGGALLGSVTGLAGAAVASSVGIAEQNKLGRDLGLPTGAAKAFDADYKQFDLSTSDLETVRAAQADSRRWTPFIAAGLTPEQIRSQDAASLLTEFDKAASGKYSDWQREGKPAGAMADAYKFTDILSGEQLRVGSSYPGSAFDQAGDNYRRDAKQAEIDQATADQATKDRAALDADLAKNANALEAALSHLTPTVVTIADRFTDAVVAFAKSGELAKDMDSLVTGFDAVGKAADWVAGKLNGLYPADSGTNTGPTLKANSFGAKAFDYGEGLWDRLNGRTHAYGAGKDIRFDWLWSGGGKAASTGFDDLEKQYRLPTGLLSNVERQESSGGTDPKLRGESNKDAGPAGPFQIDRATAERWGVKDRMSESDSAAGAAKGLGQLIERYHGDVAAAVAAYDGFSGLDADIGKYGNKWRDHLSEFGSEKAVKETSNYLKQIEAHGTDLRYSGDDNQAAIVAAINAHMTRSGTQTRPDDLNTPGLFAGPTQRQANNTGQMNPILLDVTVSAPAGSSVNTSIGGMAR